MRNRSWWSRWRGSGSTPTRCPSDAEATLERTEIGESGPRRMSRRVWLAGDWGGDILPIGPSGWLPGQAFRTERWCAVSTSLARLGSTPEAYERIGIQRDHGLAWADGAPPARTPGTYQ